MSKKSLVGSYTIPQGLQNELAQEYKENDSISSQDLKNNINQNDYQKKRFERKIDLESTQSYKELMEQRAFERDEFRVKKLIKEKEANGEQAKLLPRKRKKRWDVTPEEWQKQQTSISDLVLKEKVPIINGIPLNNNVLNKILPSGYRIVPPPPDYKPLDPSLAPDITEAPPDYYVPPSEEGNQIIARNTEYSGVPLKEVDMKYFGKLVQPDKASGHQTIEQKNELEILSLLLKIKNGSLRSRKHSLRKLIASSRKYGPKLLFNQILPILLEPSLDIQERHLLVKVIGRILFQLDDLVRPYTDKILIVISPLLIDENFTMRLEAREIISSLSKAAGLSNMISNLRPDLDHVDEYIRNITSRVFAIVANTLGLVNFFPFLKAVIKSKKNWMARHTGVKIIQQLCVMLGGGNGSSILPYLPQLIELLKPVLSDEMLQVRTMAASTVAQLAESVKPYGIESFESILEPAWIGLKKHRGKGLASFLKCIGAVIPLMVHDPNYEEYSNYYTKELMYVITREFQSPDNDMKIAILTILANLPMSKSLFTKYDTEVVQPFFKFFWNRRIATDSQQLSRLVVDTTTQLALSFEFLDILEMIVLFTKDENENLRKMSLEAINKMIITGKDELIGLDSHLEARLVDGILFAFQEQTMQQHIYLQAFGTVVKTLGIRVKPHMNSIISTILYRLKNKSSEVRQQSSDLITTIAPVIKICSENDEQILLKLVLILYESLGEVYPEVLGSILNSLYACIDSIDKTSLYLMLNPSLNQILPTLTPILKNRHEKVQEASVKLVGLIAKKNAETINAKEWMRICFEMLDMLKSTKKRIRIAANRTFGYIAKTIGPQDVLAMLLNNLRVQERQLRVCTAVAIGIVAETCEPFTVLPALMNEYRIPDKNVQNGLLKALSFLFEYIQGDMIKDYLYAITPLLENALTDRDLVHRQTAAAVIRHMALNCIGLTNDGYFDVFIHYLNLLLPNIFITSPHVISRVLESLDALRLVLGNGTYTNYVWAGLFHPARKVRAPYWKMYNAAYVQNSDTLVPYYPRIDTLPDESNFNYEIEELDIFL